MVGDMPELNIENMEMDLKEYFCMDCENKFKGLGKSVICPACKSSNIEIVSAE
jgi:Zn finger protein HypA/HybF involved in hydrogenase expression